jgi:hypothetical protein
MILLMESCLTRNSKTKERLCCDMIENENDIGQLRRQGAGRTRAILLELVVVIREAQEGLLGMRPETLHPGWSTSWNRTLVVGLFHPRKGHHCRKI